MKKVLVGVVSTAIASMASAQYMGPTPYLQASDSPFASLGLHLYDFEHKDVPLGATASAGGIYGPAGNADSVDGDDGNIDGFGTAGHSWFSSAGTPGVTWTFDANVLGALPTHVGIVWTDGSGTITFQAWDENGVSLGVVNGNHAGAGNNGDTAEDRFYGIIHSGGISKINLRNSSGGIELDHLQYGAVPEPATMAALGLGMAALARRKRK
ncbi:MAG: PEP-CTERM sorting domain-containing protein [Armatimonadetes bacterium]|nr:PEP-CTERM sorting domain-containing protein [Armatimonadota bacterium]